MLIGIRRKTFRRGHARIRADSARFRRTSAKNIFWRTPPNVHRTFGGLRRSPRGYGRIRADSAANWRIRLRVHSKNVRRQKPPLQLHHGSPRKDFRCGRPSAAEIIKGSGLGLGLWYSNPNPNSNPFAWGPQALFNVPDRRET